MDQNAYNVIYDEKYFIYKNAEHLIIFSPIYLVVSLNSFIEQNNGTLTLE